MSAVYWFCAGAALAVFVTSGHDLGAFAAGVFWTIGIGIAIVASLGRERP